MQKFFETEHYIFYFHSDSIAEKDILQISAEQEKVFNRMATLLDVNFPIKILYYLCQSPEEVGIFCGDNEPCNGFTRYPNSIYAVYNEEIKCIGAHEDTHILSYQINRPDCAFLREGLAMKADEVWWGIQNLFWCKYFMENRKLLPIEKLFDNDYFYSYSDAITYPIAGAFVDWFIDTYSKETFILLYCEKENYVKALETLLDKTITTIEEEFLLHLRSQPYEYGIQERINERISSLPLWKK